MPSQALTAMEAAGKGSQGMSQTKRNKEPSPEKGAEMLAWTDIRRFGWDEQCKEMEGAPLLSET